MTSPIITSTQNNYNGQPNSSRSETCTIVKQPNCQTEDIVSNSSLRLNSDAVSDPFGTVPGASQEENRKSETVENTKEKNSVTQKEVKQSERQKPPESLEFVFQKVSKNLRDRRLRELELKNQQCEKRGEHGERVVSGDSASKSTTDVLGTSISCTTSTLLSDNLKTCPSNSLVQDTLSSGKQSRTESEDRKQQTGTRNIAAVLREKMDADAEVDLHAKLSGFTFKPRKMKPSIHDFNACSDVSGELQTECNLGGRNLHSNTESRKSKQKPVIHDESTSSLTDTEKNERKETQNQCQNLSECGGRRTQVSCVGDVGDSRREAICSTLKELDKDNDKSAQGKSFSRMKESDNTENQGRQQTRVNIGDETEGEGFTRAPALNSSTYINDPAPSKSGHTKSTVASSTLAKLSRFAFTFTTEPTTTAQSKVEKSPRTRVERGPLETDGAECSRANYKVKRTLMDKVMGALAPPATELTPGKEHDQGTDSTHPANDSNNIKMVNHGPFHYQSTVNVKKRKCFELGPPTSSVAGSKGPFSALSLFGSVELSNDVFDTDWDQEVSKKAKV